MDRLHATYRADSSCPYCGKKYQRDQFHASELVVCDDCGKRFVSDVEFKTVVSRIEGEVSRLTAMRAKVQGAYA
jgi:ribosomal protein L37AE/L43A